jgi:hypothetical protein
MKSSVVLGALLCIASTSALSQTASKPRIEFVNLGGNDCPPCMAWRATELPKLQAMPEWKLVKFHYVTKAVPSPVPSAFFFPGEAKHLQPVLAAASNGWSGSPHQAIVVDGKVVDYWWGTEKSDPHQLAAMFRAIDEGKPLPREVCTQLHPNNRRQCNKAS